MRITQIHVSHHTTKISLLVSLTGSFHFIFASQFSSSFYREIFSFSSVSYTIDECVKENFRGICLFRFLRENIFYHMRSYTAAFREPITSTFPPSSISIMTMEMNKGSVEQIAVHQFHLQTLVTATFSFFNIPELHL